MRLFSLDVETTGLDPKKHSIVQLGIVSWDLFDKAKPVEIFNRYCIPEDMVWSIYCLNLHESLLKDLMSKSIPIDKDCIETEPFSKKLQVPTSKLYQEIQKWLRVIGHLDPKTGEPAKMIVCGKNYATFDTLFLQELPGYKELHKRRIIDPTFCYIRNSDAIPPELAECKKRAAALGCSFEHDHVSHDALEDALDVKALVQFAWDHKQFVLPESI